MRPLTTLTTFDPLPHSRSTHEDTDFASEMVKKFRAKYMTKTNKSITTVTQNMSKTALQMI
ncbi:hypothetical protein MHK_000256 [Candidatus Magnetomorum sp. HK-1]|nr:hypothetical protein MHK_000256 [Candidatus Magnetomorum sp. HK-1]